MIIDNEDKNPILETSTPTLPVLGEAICEKEIPNTIRNKLVNKFIEIATNELKEYDDTIEIYRYTVLTDPSGINSIPRLIIHTKVESIREFKNTLKRLREYFQIQGGLRLPEMGNNYITEDGEFKYFPSEDNDLNLILDFVEYKCNNIYREIGKKRSYKK